jgi:hypothetical protein
MIRTDATVSQTLQNCSVSYSRLISTGFLKLANGFRLGKGSSLLGAVITVLVVVWLAAILFMVMDPLRWLMW